MSKRSFCKQNFEEKVEKFIDSFQGLGPLERISKTFRFLKSHLRNNDRRKGQKRYISILPWQNKLAEAEDVSCPQFDEEGILGDPPTKEEILAIIKTMKNNAAQGLDGIPLEFF